MQFRCAIVFPCLIALCPAAPAQVEPAPTSIGLQELYRLDLLPRYRQSESIGMLSSYDRTGGNDDGFSGKYSYIRKEGDALVIGDLKGPGCIYRIWTPTPTDDFIEFYFDGETEPRVKVKFRELFTGDHPPFVRPIVGYGSGGFYDYLPMPYRQSCKILFRGPRMQFFQINYANYAAGTPIQSFVAAELKSDEIEFARKLISFTGGGISAWTTPPGSAERTTRVARKLQPGKAAKIFEAKRGGRIVGLRLSPASAFAGKDRAIILRTYWNGGKGPAFSIPAGDFFGFSWGERAMRSLMVGTDGDTCYCYFPMPFDQSAKIELVNESASGPAVEVRAEVVTCDVPQRTDEACFYAVWRRENPTINGKPFTYIDTPGRGHIVGVTLQAQGSVPGITPFFEGDDVATIDSEMVIHGTGSEDSFNGGWYDVMGRWEGRASYPLSGCLDYKRPMARSGGYRLFLIDAYSFRKSILHTIEHAPEKNDHVADYVGVTYLYADSAPSGNIAPPLAQRNVVDPKRLVFTPGWYMPIHAFSIQNATLTKKTERIANQEVRYLSMRGTGEDIFGQHSLVLLCDVPAPGRYKVIVDAMAGPDQAIFQLFKDERAVAGQVDLYGAARTRRNGIPIGELELAQGLNQVFFKLTGKNAQSSGLGFDLVTLILERVD